MKDVKETDLKYCLYARKSSESDERQAMSIDGQLGEMKEIARRNKLNVVYTITESHSAKETGQRPEFNRLLDRVHRGTYNAIITWAPDRLSRNAGDLGRIVDLMDQGKLTCIRTHSQTFSNNPNEKFLLMILCSQAKLENDNRGINVKRGLKNKCSMGIRPGVAPIGYVNIMKANRIASVELDPERAPVIKQMFQKVANEGYSGRMVKRWLDDMHFRTKRGCHLSLSRIYATLNNPFYYGEFKYGENWFKGTHQKIVTRQLFDRAQIQLQVAPRQWNKQVFPFKKLCICGHCGGNVTAEIKYRRLKNSQINSHIYYHCNRVRDYDCDEPYITEEELIRQLVIYLPKLKLNISWLMDEFINEIKRFHHLKELMSDEEASLELTPHNTHRSRPPHYSDNEKLRLQEYLLHILQFGTPEERVKILGGIESKFSLAQRKLRLI